MKKRLLFAVLGTLFCVVALGLYFSPLFFLSDMCGMTPHSSATSPDQKYTATVYDIDCGATTRFNRQINIRMAGTDFNTDTADRIFWASGDSNITLKWISAQQLKITVSGNVEEVNQQVKEWDRIHIDYAGLDKSQKHPN